MIDRAASSLRPKRRVESGAVGVQTAGIRWQTATTAAQYLAVMDAPLRRRELRQRLLQQRGGARRRRSQLRAHRCPGLGVRAAGHQAVARLAEPAERRAEALQLLQSNGYLSSRGGCQHRWHALVKCDHGDSTTSRFGRTAPLSAAAAACSCARPRTMRPIALIQCAALGVSEICPAPPVRFSSLAAQEK
jgi:hypothetical protein